MSSQSDKTTPPKTLTFHWRFVILPLGILLLSIVLAAYFYSRLPAQVAYHFKLDGSPDKWARREIVTTWLLAPQLLLTSLAIAISWGTAKLAVMLKQAESMRKTMERILWLMGNMVGLPQSILCFAMLDIFSYNSYRIHLLPLWLFALVVMVPGGIILGIALVRAVQQALRAIQ